MHLYLRLLRVSQWYKNLVIFLALFFTDNLLNQALFTDTLLGLLSLCLVSSSYYIVNDLRDHESDRLHPEKKNRPIASGAVGVNTAVFVSAACLVGGLVLAYELSPGFALFPALLFASSLAYTLGLKDIAFIDIHMIALNFLLRAVSGAVLIDVAASPWLVSTVFFLALLLGVSKRRNELNLLGEKASGHKRVYEVYSERLLSKLLLIVAGVLLINYSLYTFMVHEGGAMMATIPFATFIVFRYLYLSDSNHEAARKTQLLFTDPQIAGALISWVAASFVIIHYFM